jgi:hypothetical protein
VGKFGPRPRLTVAEHDSLGKRFCDMHAETVDLTVEIGHTYGTSSKASALVQKIERAIIAAKSEMEEELHRDHPEIDGHEAAGIYWGNTSDRSST